MFECIINETTGSINRGEREEGGETGGGQDGGKEGAYSFEDGALLDSQAGDGHWVILRVFDRQDRRKNKLKQKVAPRFPAERPHVPINPMCVSVSTADGALM